MRLFTVGEMMRICADVVGCASADDEAREILSAVLGVSRSWPTVHAGETINEEATADALFASRMRATGMPLQYAVGKAPFRHLTLAVDQRVLIPRPETEMLVDLVLKGAPHGAVADVGTGSGAIAISLATEGAYERVIGTDLSADALHVARDNALRFEAQISGAFELLEGSLLDPLAGRRLDAIVSNPPYIAEEEMESLPPEVRDWEPHLALKSGPDGLDAIREIVRGAPELLVPGGLLALEVDTRRADRVADIFKGEDVYDKIEIIADLTGRARFVSGRRR